MEDNVALGIRISVTVVLVASLVATVLTLTVIASSILGGGQNKLQTGLTAIQQSDLQQFANSTKKGSVVKATLNLYQGEPLAILVKTIALHTDSTLNDAPGSDQQAQSGVGWYFNYGVVLKDESGNPAGSKDLADGTHRVVFDAGSEPNTGALLAMDGVAHLEGALAVNNGVKTANYDTAGTVTIGNAEAILDNGLFYSQLIKDITGEIIGICFTQQK